jgi:hypothetical protein
LSPPVENIESMGEGGRVTNRERIRIVRENR